MKFGRNVLHVNMHRLTAWDFWFDITLWRWRPWHHFRKVLLHGDWRQSICCEPMQQFLICRTFLLVNFMNRPQTMMFLIAAAAVCYADMHLMSLQRHVVLPSWGASSMH